MEHPGGQPLRQTVLRHVLPLIVPEEGAEHYPAGARMATQAAAGQFHAFGGPEGQPWFVQGGSGG